MVVAGDGSREDEDRELKDGGSEEGPLLTLTEELSWLSSTERSPKLEMA